MQLTNDQLIAAVTQARKTLSSEDFDQAAGLTQLVNNPKYLILDKERHVSSIHASYEAAEKAALEQNTNQVIALRLAKIVPGRPTVERF